MLFSLLFLLVALVVLVLIIWFGIVLIRRFLVPIMDKTIQSKAFDSNKLSESATLRSMVIGILALAMLIPLGLVQDTVYERGNRYESVLNDIANTWGTPQTVMAAMVIVPYIDSIETQETITDEHEQQRTVNKVKQIPRQAFFLPKTLDINVNLADEIRQRGIFKSLVYNADITVDAEFEPFDVNALSDNIETIQWDKAWLAVGLTDTRAINRVNTVKWDNTEKSLSPGTQTSQLASGFHTLLNLPPADSVIGGNKSLQLDMNVKGSGAFQFTPFGETTHVEMTSTWPHPSFTGSALPDERNISEDGFSASWTIPHLARNYQQRWSNALENADLAQFTAGVSMFEPVSLYSQITRAVKYGLLFIGLTFLTLFIFEMAIDRRLHIVQYALIGVALSLFYLVLLSLSEHVAFIKAYGSAALLTITMISCYVWVALRSLTRAVVVFVLLAALYAILYSLLQFEDFALLLGTGLLVFVVMVLMFVTRNIQKQSIDANADKELVSSS